MARRLCRDVQARQGRWKNTGPGLGRHASGWTARGLLCGAGRLIVGLDLSKECFMARVYISQMQPGALIEDQVFLVDPGEGVPEGFCPWAWADIRRDILTVAYGADIPGMRQPGTVITGCTDWLRPVLFKVERMDKGNND